MSVADLVGRNVETGDAKSLVTEQQGKRQPDVPHADDADAGLTGFNARCKLGQRGSGCGSHVDYFKGLRDREGRGHAPGRPAVTARRGKQFSPAVEWKYPQSSFSRACFVHHRRQSGKSRGASPQCVWVCRVSRQPGGGVPRGDRGARLAAGDADRFGQVAVLSTSGTGPRRDGAGDFAADCADGGPGGKAEAWA